MRVLGISNDPTMALRKGQVEGDAHYRNIAYGKVLDQLHLVTPTHGHDESPVYLSDNVVVHPVRLLARASFVVQIYRRASALVEAEPFDLVYTQDSFESGLVGYRIKRRFNLPLLLSFPGDTIDNDYWIGERFRNRVFNHLGHWVIKRADGYRIVSTTEREKLLNLGVPADRIWNIGWIADQDRFRNAEGDPIRRRLLRDDERTLALYVGRFVKQKDLGTLLRAFALVSKEEPSTRLVLVGDGELVDDVMSLAEDLEIAGKVSLEGSIPYERIPDYYAAADLFVLSSIYEGNARVLAEAASAGLPIVSTEVSGTRDSVRHDETGLIVPPRDPVRFGAAVLTLIRDQERMKRLGRNGRAHVADAFDEERLLREFRSMCETLVARGPGPVRVGR